MAPNFEYIYIERCCYLILEMNMLQIKPGLVHQIMKLTCD